MLFGNRVVDLLRRTISGFAMKIITGWMDQQALKGENNLRLTSTTQETRGKVISSWNVCV